MGAEKSGEAGAVTAGALNPKGDDWPKSLDPCQKAGVAARVGFDLELTKVAAQSIFRPGDVRVLVCVDSYGHVGWNVCDTQCCHRPPLLDGLVVGSRARGHYCDGALTSLLSGHCSLGAVLLRWSLTPRRQIKTRARSLYSEGSTLWQQPSRGSSQNSESGRHWLGQTDPNIQAIAQRAAQDVETQHMVPPERSRRFELMVRPRLWE